MVSEDWHMARNICQKSMGTSGCWEVSPGKADGGFRGCFIFHLPNESPHIPFSVAQEKMGVREEGD